MRIKLLISGYFETIFYVIRRDVRRKTRRPADPCRNQCRSRFSIKNCYIFGTTDRCEVKLEASEAEGKYRM